MAFYFAVTNSTCLKKKLLLIGNTSKNLVDSVAEGTVSEPKFYFQYGQDERQCLQTYQKNPNEPKLEYRKK